MAVKLTQEERDIKAQTFRIYRELAGKDRDSAARLLKMEPSRLAALENGSWMLGEEFATLALKRMEVMAVKAVSEHPELLTPALKKKLRHLQNTSGSPVKGNEPMHVLLEEPLASQPKIAATLFPKGHLGQLAMRSERKYEGKPSFEEICDAETFLRSLHGVTQRGLAERLGVNLMTVRRLEGAADLDKKVGSPILLHALPLVFGHETLQEMVDNAREAKERLTNDMPPDIDIGNAIRMRRLEMGISQEQLSQDTGILKRDLIQFEKHHNLKTLTLHKLVKVLDMLKCLSPRDLVDKARLKAPSENNMDKSQEATGNVSFTQKLLGERDAPQRETVIR